MIEARGERKSVRLPAAISVVKECLIVNHLTCNLVSDICHSRSSFNKEKPDLHQHSHESQSGRM